MGAIDHRHTTRDAAATDAPPEALPGRRRSILTALTALEEIITAMCPELRCSGTWEPRHAYGAGARPERKHDELHVWRPDRGGPIVHVMGRHMQVKTEAGQTTVIRFEARLEPEPNQVDDSGRLVGEARLGDDLGEFLEALLTWTRPASEHPSAASPEQREQERAVVPCSSLTTG